MVFFFYEPPEAKREAFRRFQAAFLNSATILEFCQWQRNDPPLQHQRKRALQEALFRVLQEQFCGVTLPEGELQNSQLYITLNRRSKDIRQSAQPVVREIDFRKYFELAMEEERLLLRGKRGEVSGLELPISLPFLDYIVAKRSGELGRGLLLSYRDRLEQLMTQLIERLPAEDEHLVLLKQNENGTLSTQTFALDGDTMEVEND